MNYRHLFLILLSLSTWAFAEPSCRDLLTRPNLEPKMAIANIVKHLAFEVEGSGFEKHKMWMDMVSLYNKAQKKYWIASPCLKTAADDVACWGDIRGHLLVFQNSGRVFKSFNPQRPNPQAGQDGLYVIDWSDPTLKEVK